MKLPEILSLDASQADAILLHIDLSPQLEAFEGHFPNNPLLPGVVQIDWAMRFAQLHLGIVSVSARDFQVKFRNKICPNEPLSLYLQLDRHKNQISFKYISKDNLMSSGQLKLGALA